MQPDSEPQPRTIWSLLRLKNRLHEVRNKEAANEEQNSRRFKPRSTITLTDRSVLRGTTASVLLSWFGHRLRSTAGGIGHASNEAEDEYQRSFEVEELDIFLSHSWHAHWALKYFTLVFYFNAAPAIAVGIFSSVLVTTIRFVGPLEPITNFIDYQLTPRHGCFVIGSIGFFITVFFWQDFLVKVNAKAVSSMFLDKVCIHQTDQEKKAQGIKSIGAILGKSRMVLVTWDPTYFSRLWCTFELAAYKYARPTSDVVVLPVNIGCFIMILIATNFGSQVIVAILKIILFRFGSEGLLGSHLSVYISVYTLQSVIVAAYFRDYVQELNNMDHQLKNFSVRNADCFCCSNNHKLPGTDVTLPCDRELVNASIAHWHGQDRHEEGLNKFDELIRTTFRADIAQAFRGSRVPYVFVLLVSVWAGFYQLDRIGPARYYHCKDVSSYLCQCDMPEFTDTTEHHTKEVAQRLLGTATTTQARTYTERVGDCRDEAGWVSNYRTITGNLTFCERSCDADDNCDSFDANASISSGGSTTCWLFEVVKRRGRYTGNGNTSSRCFVKAPICNVYDADWLGRVLEVIHSVLLCYPLNIALFIRICIIVHERVPASWPTAARRILDVLLACVASGILYVFINLGFFLIREGPGEDIWHGILFMIFEAILVYFLYRRKEHAVPEFIAHGAQRVTNVFDSKLTSLGERMNRTGSARHPPADAGRLLDKRPVDDVTIEMAERPASAEPERPASTEESPTTQTSTEPPPFF